MPTTIPTRFAAVPTDALALLMGANYRTSESVSDIINWCLTMFGKVRQGELFYWVPAGSPVPAQILITPVVSTQTRRISADLTPLAWTALATWRQQWRCEDDAALARVAGLAPYFDRNDGRLACSNSPRLARMRYLT